MANHGKCINCWWWESIKFDLRQAKWVLGCCWMWKNQTADDCYCPDYWNRKKGDKENGSLEEWARKSPETFIYPDGTRFNK